MKKTLAGLILCSIVLAGAAPSALAAPVTSSLDTKGDIKFEVDENPETEIIVPDENEDLNPPVIELPGEGNSSNKGAIRLEFVPNLRFGTSNDMTAGQVKQAVNTIKYNFKGEVDKNDIAPFIQVRDGRGIVGDGAKWDVTVKGTPFTAKATPENGLAADDVLTNATIALNGSTLTMDYADSAKANTLVEGNTAAVISTEPTGAAVTVLKTKDGQSTSGHRVSNVFDSSYVKGKKYDTVGEEGKVPEVEFTKPKGQAPVADVTYESTLTWTLTYGL